MPGPASYELRIDKFVPKKVTIFLPMTPRPNTNPGVGQYNYSKTVYKNPPLGGTMPKSKRNLVKGVPLKVKGMTDKKF